MAKKFLGERMDRPIEIEKLPEDVYNEILLEVNTGVLTIAKEAQDKINDLLKRFGIHCSLSLSYSVETPSPISE